METSLEKQKSRSGGVFSIKEACKGAGGEDRESETSPQHPIFRTEAIKIYELGNQPSLARRFEIGSEGEDFFRRSDTSGDTITDDAGEIMADTKTQEPILGKLLTSETVERFLIHTLRPDEHFVSDGFGVEVAIRFTFGEHLPDSHQ